MPKVNNRNRGSALVVAIVAMMFLMVVSLVLLLASYSLFHTTVKQSNTEQCNELAQTMSLAVERELDVPDCTTPAEEKSLIESGDYPMWTYLRFQLLQEDWQAGEIRTMTLNSDSLAEANAVLTAEISYSEPQDGVAEVTINIVCEKGGQKSAVKSVYALTITPLDGSFSAQVLSAAYNPEGSTIEPEHWSYQLLSRG